MARPRKSRPEDPLRDLSKKAEILAREMRVQSAAIERLKEFGKRPQPLRIPDTTTSPIRRRAVR